MNPRRIFAIFLRQLYLFKRGSRIITVFYWSTFDLILWGFITGYFNTVGREGFDFVTVLLGAVILWNFLIRVQYGVSVSFMEDLWVRNFINVFSTPITIREYAAGLLLTSAFQSILSLLFVAVVAWFLFAYNLFLYGFLLIPFVAVLYVFGWAIGLLATAIVLRFGPSAEIIAWSLPALFAPLTGVFYPVSALPEALRPIANAIPTTYVFEGMRAVVLHGSFDSGTLLSAFLLSVLFLLVSYTILVRVYRYVLARGLFTRFSVE